MFNKKILRIVRIIFSLVIFISLTSIILALFISTWKDTVLVKICFMTTGILFLSMEGLLLFFYKGKVPRAGPIQEDRLIIFYGDLATEEGHDGPLWFVKMMRLIYLHPRLSWVILACLFGSSCFYFLR